MEAIIIDLSNLYYRAYYAAPKNLSHNGIPTGVTYLLYKMLYKLYEKNPHPMLVTLEGGRTSRNDIYDGYKANRSRIDDEVFEICWKDTLTLIELSGIPIWKIEGFEADDLMASYAKQRDCVIYTKDCDLYGAMRDGVRVLQPITGGVTMYTHEDFKAEHGFHPQYWYIYKALVGDKSDNIPGIPQFGAKAAERAVIKFRDDFEQMKRRGSGKPYDNLRANWSDFLRNLQLCSLNESAPITLEPAHPDWTKTHEWLTKERGFSMEMDLA